MGEHSARIAAIEPLRVKSSPAMSHGEQKLYIGLTILAVAATTGFAWFWFRYLALEDHMPASATPMTPTYHRSAIYRAVDSLIARGLVEHYRLIGGYGLTGWCLQPRWRPLAVHG